MNKQEILFYDEFKVKSYSEYYDNKLVCYSKFDEFGRLIYYQVTNDEVIYWLRLKYNSYGKLNCFIDNHGVYVKYYYTENNLIKAFNVKEGRFVEFFDLERVQQDIEEICVNKLIKTFNG